MDGRIVPAESVEDTITPVLESNANERMRQKLAARRAAIDSATENSPSDEVPIVDQEASFVPENSLPALKAFFSKSANDSDVNIGGKNLPARSHMVEVVKEKPDAIPNLVGSDCGQIHKTEPINVDKNAIVRGTKEATGSAGRPTDMVDDINPGDKVVVNNSGESLIVCSDQADILSKSIGVDSAFCKDVVEVVAWNPDSHESPTRLHNDIRQGRFSLTSRDDACRLDIHHADTTDVNVCGTSPEEKTTHNILAADETGSFCDEDAEDEMWVDSTALCGNALTSPTSGIGQTRTNSSSRVSTDSSKRSDDELQLELEETIFAREMLDAEIRGLRAEIRRREEKRDALLEREAELTEKSKEKSVEEKPPPSLDDFLSGRVHIARPTVFEMNDDDDDVGDLISAVSLIEGDAASDNEDTSPKDSLDMHWETHLEAFGVSKCRLCGMRLPLDVDAIEKHSKECSVAVKTYQYGKCHQCGESLPLDTEEIERHLAICPKRLDSQTASPSQQTGAAQRKNFWTGLFRGNKAIETSSNAVSSGSAR